MFSLFIISLLFPGNLLMPSTANQANEPYLNGEEYFEARVIESVKRGVSAPKKITESLGIHTTSTATMAVDIKSGKTLFQKEPERQLPIASISKLMTALVFLEHNPGFDKTIAMGAEENRLEGAKLYVDDGEVLKLEELFYTSLVGSANNATMALARATGLSNDQFVILMNKKAKDLGMANTSFREPTGLSEYNVSTASDVIKLAQSAFLNPIIQKATTLKEYDFTTISGKPHRIKTPDKLLESYLDITGAKTGFTNEAGNSFVMQVKNKTGNEIIVVVLGSETADSRFQEAKALATWSFENYRWQ